MSNDLITNEKYGFYNNYTIDSTKLRLNVFDVEFLKSKTGLNQEITEITISEHGEFEILETEIKRKNMLSIEFGNTFVRFAIVRRKMPNGETYEYLYIFFSAKMLFTKYLFGISNDTIKKIYDGIMSLGIVKFSYDAFLRGSLVDTDIKFDFVLPSGCEEIKDTQSNFIKSIIAQGRIGINKAVYGKNKDESVYFNDRAKSSKRNPYIGFYNKNKELDKDKNREVKKDIEILENTMRMEFTISGKKMFDRMELPNSLKELLDLLDEHGQLEIETELDLLLSNVVYEFGYVYEAPQGNRANYDVIVINRIIQRMLEDGKENEYILNFLIDGVTFSNANVKYKYTKKITGLIHGLEAPRKKANGVLSGFEIREFIKSRVELERILKLEEISKGGKK